METAMPRPPARREPATAQFPDDGQRLAAFLRQSERLAESNQGDRCPLSAMVFRFRRF